MMRMIGALAWVLAVSTPAMAGNLLTNPDFDSDLAGWTGRVSGDAPPPYWDGSLGYPTPGAAVAGAYLTGQSSYVEQCVDIASQSVDFVAYANIRQSGGGNSYYGEAALMFFGQVGCNGYLSQAFAKPRWVGNGSVVHRLDAYAMPAGAQSVRVSLRSAAYQSSIVIAYDHVGFGPAGTIELPAPTANLLSNPDFDGQLFNWQRPPREWQCLRSLERHGRSWQPRSRLADRQPRRR